MIKTGDVVIYKGNKKVDYIGKRADVVKVGETFATIKFENGVVYDCARLTNLVLDSVGKPEAVVCGESVIAWGLRNKETGKIRKETFGTRDEAKGDKASTETVIKVEIREVV